MLDHSDPSVSTETAIEEHMSPGLERVAHITFILYLVKIILCKTILCKAYCGFWT